MPDTHTVDARIAAELADRLGGPGPGFDLADAAAALKATNFHCPAALLDALLVEHRRGADEGRSDGA